MRGWLAIFAVTLGIFALMTSELLPVGLLTPIGTALDVSEGTTALMVTVPGLAAAVAAPLVTVATARNDRRARRARRHAGRRPQRLAERVRGRGRARADLAGLHGRRDAEGGVGALITARLRQTVCGIGVLLAAAMATLAIADHTTLSAAVILVVWGLAVDAAGAVSVLWIGGVLVALAAIHPMYQRARVSVGSFRPTTNGPAS
ncbi:hypothetical protein SAMN05444920_12837 [Nonomuraea solani]|uniref:Uncharacterized protein n=1 Tax=Nonomuraea solani TaxID=1144553 RepID=A0A1H6EXK4_9ACTN|nr:MFS transporter [Nonomuraea solani]SEH02610.1 hypothetical protein SAMN05444920_12837 [Nonomuraea solani]